MGKEKTTSYCALREVGKDETPPKNSLAEFENKTYQIMVISWSVQDLRLQSGYLENIQIWILEWRSELIQVCWEPCEFRNCESDDLCFRLDKKIKKKLKEHKKHLQDQIQVIKGILTEVENEIWDK